MLIIFRIQIFH